MDAYCCRVYNTKNKFNVNYELSDYDVLMEVHQWCRMLLMVRLCTCGGRGYMKISVLFSQFCYESKIALKIKSIKRKLQIRYPS